MIYSHSLTPPLSFFRSTLLYGFPHGEEIQQVQKQIFANSKYC